MRVIRAPASAAQALRANIESGEHFEPSRERFGDFLLEWLSTMEAPSATRLSSPTGR
jgi:hypothetical protein